MSKLIYFGSVRDGVISLPKRISKEVRQRFNGYSIKVTFERKRKIRSNLQNAYYWGVVIPEIVAGMIDMGNELQLGNAEDHEIVHQLLKDRLLSNGNEVILDGGEIEKLPSSTRKLTTTEMAEYTENVRRWASEHLRISIPDPEEQGELNL